VVFRVLGKLVKERRMEVSRYMGSAKYVLIALILKVASIYPSFYRQLANKFGARSRRKHDIPSYYGRRAKDFLSRIEKYQMVKKDDAVLELGTGWVHFESIVIRLFHDVKTSLFDVWDNRQLDALKHYVLQLEALLYREMDLTIGEKERLKNLIYAISEADSFDTLYKQLNFQYEINPGGTLETFPDNNFQLVYSYNVLEHVHCDFVPDMAQGIYRILKPGGFSCHEIDLTDHLVTFGNIQGLSKKNYLNFSDKIWKMFFENRVQYINRIQCSEWLSLFQSTGLELVENETVRRTIDSETVSKAFKHLEKHDLDCIRLKVVHRKAPLPSDH
jgi:hypothetical protein